MTDTVLAIDPGDVTGWSTWFYDDDVPLWRGDYGLIKGGDEGWMEWAESHLGLMRPDVIICEQYVPDGRITTFQPSPLWIEGSLKTIVRALALPPVIWQRNNMKALVRDVALKRAGFWLEKSDPKISWKDADDVHDSERHALAWAKSMDHQPTVAAYWPET